MKLLKVVLILCLFSLSVIAADSDPVKIPRVEGEIVIDGSLDEPLWKKARRLTLDFETSPAENVPASVMTEVYIAYDRENLYIGILAHDPDPSKIVANLSDRDQISTDDVININLDTFNDERRSYFFSVNPLGVQMDGILTPGTVTSGDQNNISWDAIWESACKITDLGFTAEVAIPFASVQFQRVNGSQIWGLDISRWYQRGVKIRYGLVPLDRSVNSYQAQMRKIEGFEDVSAGTKIEINPTITSVASQERDNFPDGDYSGSTGETQYGVSASWAPSTNVMANMALNPDFSQIEADARQVDINEPNALRFAEKRPFFLENADFFPGYFQTIYTRSFRDPNWGVKLTGKEGNHTFGGIVVEDAVTSILIPGVETSRSRMLDQESTGGVFRYKYDLNSRYTIGALATARESEDYSNIVYGVDGLLRFTDSDMVGFQFISSATDYPDEFAQQNGQQQDAFNGNGYYLDYRHMTREWQWDAMGYQKDAGLRTDLGFTPAIGTRRLGGNLQRTWYQETGLWNRLAVRASTMHKWDLESDPIIGVNNIGVNISGAMQSYFSLRLNNNMIRYQNVKYPDDYLDISLSFKPLKNFSIGGLVSAGDQIDYVNQRLGSAVKIFGNAKLNIGQKIILDYNLRHDTVNVAGANLYTAAINQGSLMYNFSKRAFLRAILQYVDYQYNEANYLTPWESEYQNLFSQLLFSYKLNPRTVLFLGYTDNYYGRASYELTQADRTLFFKVGYAWQL
jgi:hypothetical protein